MTATAAKQAPTTEDINAMLCTRNEELEAEKAALADQLDRAELRVESLIGAVRRARHYAGEHLPAAAGTGIVHILESALKEAS
ncbi:hypothetical protein ACGTNG_12810 [Halomonas sp. 1390]|uniref:hypothetical protein n=1 Tax=Halomonas sp. B23F22_3 TaxID=3459516 RepID=UPI00373E2C6E